MLKPDCIERRLIGTVLKRFETAGFEIVGCKMLALSRSLLRKHYAHIAAEPFFPELETFMSSRPVMIIVLQGENAAHQIRTMVGATCPQKAEAGTIRNNFGLDSIRNVCHAADSLPHAIDEIHLFFRAEEICDLLPQGTVTS